MPKPVLPTLVDTGNPRDRDVNQAIRRLADHGGDLEQQIAALNAKADANAKAIVKTAADAQAAATQISAGLVPVLNAPVNPGTATPPTVPATTGNFPVNISLPLAQPTGIPARPNLRWFRGNMCGLRVPGITAVPGGAADPSLFLSWFYDRYSPADRATIRAAYVAQGYTHIHLSWCDSRVFGTTQAQYVTFAQELAAAGLYVGHFFCGKDQDSGKSNADIMTDITPLIGLLQAAAVIPWCCVGWELSLWRSPMVADPTSVQGLVNSIAALVVPGSNLYVHFQEGYLSFPEPGHPNADFWNPNVGKLTGILYQKALPQDNGLFQSTIGDCLTRFAGNDSFSNTSGFGHPWDFVTYEVTASFQFAGSMTQAQGDAVGLAGVYAPFKTGPGPTTAVVMGYGNGCTGNP
jgi:hypothetical protein